MFQHRNNRLISIMICLNALINDEMFITFNLTQSDRYPSHIKGCTSDLSMSDADVKNVKVFIYLSSHSLSITTIP